ncbi:MAG: methyltransferase domain-containing protein [bacterium]|nr:MAG: methyltransferase domain-containing protein [bacterium]
MKKELSAEAIQHLARGFSRSRVLLTGVELDLFTLLAGEPLSAAEVTSRLALDLRATTILLDALGAMGLLEKRDGLYATHPEVAGLLTEGSGESVLPGLRHSAHLWHTWSQLTDIVRKGGPARRPEAGGDERTEAFIGAMHVRALRDAPSVVEAVSPGPARALIDVGGGSGSYTIAFLRAVPGMRATLFDLPEVVEMARRRMEEEGLADRVTLAAGDYHEDELPPGHDLAFLSAIIHQNSHEENTALYRKVHGALTTGGRVVVRDYVMEPERTGPASGALFAVNMLVNTRGGNSYTFEEIREGLQAAGFREVRQIRDAEMSSMVQAYKR